MELLQQYADDGDDYTPSYTSTSSNLSVVKKVEIAPSVGRNLDSTIYTDVASRQVFHNPDYNALFAPVQGPVHPISSKSHIAVGSNNNLAGFVEDDHVNKFAFDEQYHLWNNNQHSYDYNEQKAKQAAVDKKKKRKSNWDADVSSGFTGPWGEYEDEILLKQQLAKQADAEAAEGTEKKSKTEAEADKDKEKEQEKEKEKGKKDKDFVETKSIFHGGQLRDYLGRSFVDHPTHLKAGQDHECFMPKKIIHTWSGHTKGVNAIRFFPKYGHLLLSCSMDASVKIWDVYNNRKCVRTYLGHSQAVRDICFTNDGRSFISAGYDRKILHWDTETGSCLGSFSNGKIPYCVKFNPDNEKQHTFLAGCSDKKIIQWDTRSGKITQEYENHLGAVNTITFVDDNRRFVTSSDDKSLRVWEWGIPVVIKLISEPHMHSMPAVSLHPSGNYFACQSLDNQIIVYGARDRFRLNKKKRFTGHLVAGYACQVNFSPDGHFIMSGDSDGRLWFWDWNNNRVMKTMKVHDKVSIACEWHPIEPSKVATASWDGVIHYMD